MRRILIFLFPLFLVACGTKSSFRTDILNITDEWAFSTGDDTSWALPGFDDNDWARLSVSGSWEEQGFQDYDGFGWYRKWVELPSSWKKEVKSGDGLFITWANTDDVDELWFNGVRIGATGSFPPDYVGKYGVKRQYVIPPNLVKSGEKNLISIRVFDGGGDGGIITEAIYLHPVKEVSNLKITPRIADEDWTFEGSPQVKIGISVEHQTGKPVKTDIGLKITTDDYQPVSEMSRKLKVRHDAAGLALFDLTLPEPGFYRCTAWAEQEGIKGREVKFNIGYEPEKIVSRVDTLPGFSQFWKDTRTQLDQVEPRFQMTLMEKKSGQVRNLYHVSMQSFGNVTIEGYYAVPKAPGKYPAIVNYMGYGSDPWLPGGDHSPDFAEFVLSTRGQGIQKPVNNYGDWILYGLDSKEEYYYRGAFMDLVRAVDFLVSRPEVDADMIVAEGGSQGGAFTLAACALDHRIKAAAPTIPFLSDYPAYFRIAPWPASTFTEYLKNHPEKEWNDIYRLLSYFDIKNLAHLIKCPVLMAAGLQDDVCPPRTNFASYNLITSEKEYHLFHDQGHSVPEKWYSIRMRFFRENLNLPQL